MTGTASVMSQSEVKTVISQIESRYQLAFKLMYGTGMRVSELCSLRLKDIDFELKMIIIHGGKGDKDRRTMLPLSLVPELSGVTCLMGVKGRRRGRSSHRSRR